MDDLISLCQLIATQRVEHIDIFDKKKHKGKTWMLYDSIIKGDITDDKEGINSKTSTLNLSSSIKDL